MRDYGVVKVRFWSWAKEHQLSLAAQRMALYCLTSPHSNALGCFRLPFAYIADDLGTDADTVRGTVSELERVGFLKHDEASGWAWLPAYLEHNPVANPNVGKSLASFVESVPDRLPFYAEFVAAVARADVAGDKRRFPDGLIDRLRNRIGNGMPNGSDNGTADGSQGGMPNQDQDQTQDQDQIQDQDQDHSRGADAPPALIDGVPEKLRDEDEAVRLWNEAAKRNGWPVKRAELTLAQRRQLSARLKGGGIARWGEVIAKCEASDFLSGRQPPGEGHQNWRLKLAFLLSPEKFNAILDGDYDNDDRPRGVRGKGGTGAAAARAREHFMGREQQP